MLRYPNLQTITKRPNGQMGTADYYKSQSVKGCEQLERQGSNHHWTKGKIEYLRLERKVSNGSVTA